MKYPIVYELGYDLRAKLKRKAWWKLFYYAPPIIICACLALYFYRNAQVDLSQVAGGAGIFFLSMAVQLFIDIYQGVWRSIKRDVVLEIYDDYINFHNHEGPFKFRRDEVLGISEVPSVLGKKFHVLALDVVPKYRKKWFGKTIALYPQVWLGGKVKDAEVDLFSIVQSLMLGTSGAGEKKADWSFPVEIRNSSIRILGVPFFAAIGWIPLMLGINLLEEEMIRNPDSMWLFFGGLGVAAITAILLYFLLVFTIQSIRPLVCFTPDIFYVRSGILAKKFLREEIIGLEEFTDDEPARLKVKSEKTGHSFEWIELPLGALWPQQVEEMYDLLGAWIATTPK